MNRIFGVLMLCCTLLSACGGSDDGVSTPKSLKVSMYGNPLTSGQVAVSNRQIAHAASDVAASAPVSASAAQATVETLQDALVARGVPATVTAQVMDGTTLHQIVMGENNGLPPTNDQFKLEPSEWLVVNFQLDDMTTAANDPAQLAAQAQFTQDLAVFTQRAAVSGKRVFAIDSIPTCDLPNQNSAADGLNLAISLARRSSNLTEVGGLAYQGALDSNGNTYNALTKDHLGADCRTPDAYLLNLWTQSIADNLASIYKASIASQ